MRRLIALLALSPVVAWGATDNINADGNYLPQICYKGSGRVEIYPAGGNNYGGGTVTLQFNSAASGSWETLCPTAADCQWGSGDSGAKPFEAGPAAEVRLNMASSTSPNVDVAIICE